MLTGGNVYSPNGSVLSNDKELAVNKITLAISSDYAQGISLQADG